MTRNPHGFSIRSQAAANHLHLLQKVLSEIISVDQKPALALRHMSFNILLFFTIKVAERHDLVSNPSSKRHAFVHGSDFTCDILVVEAGSSGRLNFFCEPMAAGKEGAENMAATELMTLIQDSISSGLLRRRRMTMSSCFMANKSLKVCPEH